MDAPFDRGEVDRASLDATERLRARLSSAPRPSQQARSRSSLPWVIAGGLFVFVAGMLANPLFESTIRSQLPFAAEILPTATVAEAEVSTLQARLAQLEARAGVASAAAPVERLARTEAKIETSTDQIARDAERIDKLAADMAALQATVAAERARGEVAATTAITAADRAQGMLTLVLVRRAIDSGRPLGALDPVLRRSFEARYPQAVQQVIALGAAPVTIASLRRSFGALRPVIGGRPAADGRLSWWDALTTTIADAVSRPASDSIVDQAGAALERGDIAGAVALLRRQSPRPAALANWLSAADRWQIGNAALGTLETTTALAPAEAVTVRPDAVPASAASALRGDKISIDLPTISFPRLRLPDWTF
ncbi:hypothetical protein [Sandarakinorhabdus sp. DWP1-3-1]|uniref:hypothetical protein n=1 Tax=Sandarakinorhabdus sp. DWP1-3-1 TaxID=2804627 RepID=UPI003CF47905